MDEIRISGLKLYGYHGYFKEEKKRGQYFEINATLFLDLSLPGATDDLSLTVNYAEACDFLAKEFEKEYVNIIETVANRLARALLIRYPVLKGVTVEVCKPEAPINEEFENVSVCVNRSRHTAFLAVGSNMGDSASIIEEAKNELFLSKDLSLIKESSLIVTKPYGNVEQADFLNGVWKVSTLLSPLELLERLHKVEADFGRERTIHWGPRTLDLDIIYYDDCVMDSEVLTIPHIDMANREFVLAPLEEVDPYVRHPLNKKRAGEMLKELRTE